jgi:hypothetical protein
MSFGAATRATRYPRTDLRGGDLLDGVARNGIIRANIEELRPTIRDYLDRARTLAAAKGIELKGL